MSQESADQLKKNSDFLNNNTYSKCSLVFVYIFFLSHKQPLCCKYIHTHTYIYIYIHVIEIDRYQQICTAFPGDEFQYTRGAPRGAQCSRPGRCAHGEGPTGICCTELSSGIGGPLPLLLPLPDKVYSRCSSRRATQPTGQVCACDPKYQHLACASGSGAEIPSSEAYQPDVFAAADPLALGRARRPLCPLNALAS